MDGLKLEKWRQDFSSQAEFLQIGCIPFLKGKSLNEVYEIKVDESQNLCIELIDESVPQQVTEALAKLLLATKPEDSV